MTLGLKFKLCYINCFMLIGARFTVELLYGLMLWKCCMGLYCGNVVWAYARF